MSGSALRPPQPRHLTGTAAGLGRRPPHHTSPPPSDAAADPWHRRTTCRTLRRAARPWRRRPPRLADRARGLRDPPPDRRAGSPARTAAGRAARARPRHAGGRPRPRQDGHHQGARRGRRRHLRAGPVHARSVAVRPRRQPRLQRPDRRAHHRGRAGLREPAAGRRDQPRAGQGPVGAPRSHAGAAGHHRRPDLRRAGPVPGPGDPEPDRVGRHLPAARSPARPLHVQGAG